MFHENFVDHHQMNNNRTNKANNENNKKDQSRKWKRGMTKKKYKKFRRNHTHTHILYGQVDFICLDFDGNYLFLYYSLKYNNNMIQQQLNE